jgi:predicted nucleic acid-binding protein
MHAGAVHALEVLMKREEALVIALQNVAEFWNAATRPIVHNGLGFTIEEAQEELTKLEGFFRILTEDAASYAAWKTLLIANRVSGVLVHDARLVAVMKTYGIAQIVTFNVSDFARFSEIEAVHPDSIA